MDDDRRRGMVRRRHSAMICSIPIARILSATSVNACIGDELLGGAQGPIQANAGLVELDESAMMMVSLAASIILRLIAQCGGSS